MPKIFISYRRSDSEDIAGRIYDRLAAHFGKDSIFFDVDAIPFGEDLRDYINASLDQCQVVLAVIGKTWLTVTDEKGDRRLDNPADWVRLELEEALKRKGQVIVIPLLVSRATLPTPDKMPSALVDLAYRNAAQARPDPDFHGDVSRLIRQLERYFDRLNATLTPVSIPAVEPNTTARKPPSVPKTYRQEAVGRAPLTIPEPANLAFEFEVVTITGIERGLLGLGQPRVTTSRRLAKAEYFVETLAKGVSLEMVKIPAGQFLMGSPANEKGRSDNESPQHSVTVPEFWLSKYPITQAQYQAVMGENPSQFSQSGANRPVEMVSWYDAVAFCQALSQQTWRTYRLPSEAEWEYACRAGTTTPFYYGLTITTDLANYNGYFTYGSGPKGVDRKTTTKVGLFVPNAFSLYDTHGNVSEWCADHSHNNYNGAPTDGSAWLSDDDSARRVLRGGSWCYRPEDCRSALRIYGEPGDVDHHSGFRAVFTASRNQATDPRI
ncbi:SUMF1/EgtB/PvdO family nonheme iron enzyme [Leptolyngbya sp. CCNP1308]|uniref:SUMF1/EgtB/PvdO family nonheme iron enzyme n=1 Tax=Leptolyngbya sp. CCNP1308 TaxID=3110255 RepID=UPI002B20B9B1|nr:SUMF1/EgtB/PvdO family nonheme iron enzyme [Leptolyngbya sp. CCNP1308]MEA5450446.1 SUMF1/EgtB/PvdO family nonheme iron enzyme [Leptolyngbya sp. CCNP1308]